MRHAYFIIIFCLVHAQSNAQVRPYLVMNIGRTSSAWNTNFQALGTGIEYELSPRSHAFFEITGARVRNFDKWAEVRGTEPVSFAAISHLGLKLSLFKKDKIEEFEAKNFLLGLIANTKVIGFVGIELGDRKLPLYGTGLEFVLSSRFVFTGEVFALPTATIIHKQGYGGSLGVLYYLIPEH